VRKSPFINFYQEDLVKVMTQTPIRSELGDFSSIVCMKAVISGIEEALGEKAAMIALIAAGRKRGKSLAMELNLGDSSNYSLEKLTEIANESLGKQGTRLCIVDKIIEKDGVYQVYTKETVCSAGEPQGSSRQCDYTMGAIQGFLETILNKRLRGKQIESVLRGGDYDVVEFSVIG
jgi:predicted hydrocarbon binding protein